MLEGAGLGDDRVKNHLVELEVKANALKNAGQNTEAAELFSLIVKEQPDWEHGTALHLLAQCYEDAGQLTLAEQNYRAALKYEPKNDIFLGGLASFLYLHGEPEAAFSAYLDLFNVYKSAADAERVNSCMTALETLGERIGWPKGLIAAKIEQGK